MRIAQQIQRKKKADELEELKRELARERMEKEDIQRRLLQVSFFSQTEPQFYVEKKKPNWLQKKKEQGIPFFKYQVCSS